ncbi:hypothetical protein A5727_25225 [Mycobacterium sp. ACS4331]|nr:hypothetical protein A5727_25225 [Mycobacterium sp. ACS4331]
MDPLGHLTVSTGMVEILCHELHIDSARIHRQSRLVSDMGLDWIALAIVAVAIEDRWGITLTEAELHCVDTIGELDDALTQRISTSRGRR